MLVSEILSEDNLKQMQEICDTMMKVEYETETFIQNFRSFLQRHTSWKLESHDRKRLLRNVATFKYKYVAALYDFLCTEYREILNRRSDAYSTEVTKMIKALMLAKEGSYRNVFSVTANEYYNVRNKAQIPADHVEDAYLGYRVSSKQGQIIRYGIWIKIDKHGRSASYWNIYQRDNARITSAGSGVVIDKILHLVGDAWETDREAQGHGLRMLALERWRDTSLLTGVVISRDGSGAIAGRTLLVPVDSHEFAGDPAYERYRGQVRNDGKFDPDKATAVLSSITAEDRRKCDDGNYADLERMMISQVDPAIDSDSKDDSDLNLWHFISNLTSTSLHAYIRGDIGAFGDAEGKKSDDEFTRLFNELMRIALVQGNNPRDLILGMLEDYIGRSRPPM